MKSRFLLPSAEFIDRRFENRRRRTRRKRLTLVAMLCADAVAFSLWYDATTLAAIFGGFFTMAALVAITIAYAQRIR
jgi:hypothetical protein